MGKLRELAGRAGRWLGLSSAAAPAAPALAAGAIAEDRFDVITWNEVSQASRPLRNLADDLAETFDYTADLLRDCFLAAYQVEPQLRDRAQVLPSRWPNHQIVAGILSSPEMDELRRDTAGDPYASALAVLSLAESLRESLERAKDAQEQAEQAEEAAEQARQAAEAVGAALAQAAEQADADGEVPADAEQQVIAAVAGAEQAEQAAEQAEADAEDECDAAAAALRQIIRRGLAQAIEDVEEEAEVMAAWGVGREELSRMDFAARAALAERLAGDRLKRFTEMIGRFKTMAAGERARRMEHVRGEIVGITLGDDLSSLIPSELAALALPALRADFAARYADARLMVYDTRGEDTAGLGAVIALIDCSTSMNEKGAGGVTREVWAKALSLALLDQARAGKRDFVAILFSWAGNHKVFRFPADRPLSVPDVIDLVECFPGGGTDFATPLTAAAAILEERYAADGTQRGDLVLITDGECDVTEDWMRTWSETKERLAFRTFGIAVTTAVGRVLDALSDNGRSVTDLADVGAVADLFRVI